MTIDKFADQHRLRVRLDECGDKIIPGKRGHLYIAGGEPCLMVTDGVIAKSSRWKGLGARCLWLGDISPNAKGVRVQDVRLVGIPPNSVPLAIKLARVRRRRVLSESQLEAARKNMAAIHGRKAGPGRDA